MTAAIWLTLAAVLPIALIHWLLSARMLQPWRLLSFLAVLLILLVYLLKRKQAARLSSTLVFWQSVQKELEASAPFQQLKRRWLILLQILILALICYSLAEPVLDNQERKGISRVVLIDVSGSMKSLEANGQRRIDRAIQRVKQLIQGLRGSEEMMIVSFGHKARTVQTWTSRRESLLQSLKSIQVQDTATELRDALRIASAALQQRQGKTELVLLSDGGFKSEDIPLEFEANIRFESIGDRADNIALTRVSIHEGQGAAQSAPSFRLFARVLNSFNSPKNVSLAVFRGEQIQAARRLSLAKNSETSVTLQLPKLDPGPLKLQVLDENSEALDDALPEDQTAFVVVPQSKTVDVVVIGAKDEDRALRFALTGEPSWRLKESASIDKQLLDKASFAVFVRTQPPEDLRCPALLIEPPTGFAGVIPKAQILAEVVDGWARDHAFLQYVDPSDVAMKSARVLSLSDGSESLLEVKGRSVVAVGQHSNQPVTVLGFSPKNSNWPLRLSFPVFVKNVLTQSLAAREGGHPLSIETGDILRVDCEARVQSVTFKGLENQDLQMPVNDRSLFFPQTLRAGLLTLESRDQAGELLATTYCAVQFGRGDESNIKARKTIKLGRRAVETEQESVQMAFSWTIWLILLGLIPLEYAVWKLRL